VPELCPIIVSELNARGDSLRGEAFCSLHAIELLKQRSSREIVFEKFGCSLAPSKVAGFDKRLS
jgi:hypothetical protein